MKTVTPKYSLEHSFAAPDLSGFSAQDVATAQAAMARAGLSLTKALETVALIPMDHDHKVAVLAAGIRGEW